MIAERTPKATFLRIVALSSPFLTKKMITTQAIIPM
jgi:hypothetical protein